MKKDGPKTKVQHILGLEKVREELLKDPFLSQQKLAETLNVSRVTAGKWLDEVNDGLMKHLTTASKMDDLLQYTKVLQYLASKLVVILETSNRDGLKILAAKVMHQIFEKSLLLKLELGIHQKPAQVLDVKISAQEKKQLDTVFGGVLNNLHSVEQIQRAIEGARKLEAANSGAGASASNLEAKIRERIAKK